MLRLSDARLVVGAINSQHDPDAWQSLHTIPKCRHRLQEKAWKLRWEPKFSNGEADRLAKLSRDFNVDFLFYNSSAILSSPETLSLVKEGLFL